MAAASSTAGVNGSTGYFMTGCPFRPGAWVSASPQARGCVLDECHAGVTARGGSYHGGMRPAEPLAAAAAVWDIAVPSRPGPVAGVKMAGFRARAKELADLPVVPYPAVTLVIDQSHLHRDVRAFTGATPTAIAAAPWLAVDPIAWAAPPPPPPPPNPRRPNPGTGTRRADHHSGTFLQDTRRSRRLTSCACPRVPQLASSPAPPGTGARP